LALYEFLCECGNVYEELISWDKNDEYLDVFCPKCQSVNKTKLMSMPAQPVNKESHDYKFKAMQPQLAQQRAAIEATSHVGAVPYNGIDDISSGEHFNPSNWEQDGNYVGIN
jgi:phage FluMu protein Com